ncbi:hypothetical protein POL68_24385 [Stigmatella sp. ncwal1]|uniref:Uncharacterized protein n=1 Tax=Stigmatella ashevillensis TaxID=2995309 RepID=A0ABT5DD80_9BACT|nr:hypothetical protein [Stigmatella ashevillena]MDC0711629.1 hypothetical protein [Stigmatella ashevillena]
MRDEELLTGCPVFEARKTGATLELERAPHPSTTRYLAIEAPGLLVLFPKDGIVPAAVPVQMDVPERVEPKRDALLHRAVVES